MEIGSEILERISRSFGQILSDGRIKVHSFREELPTKGMMVVGPVSSTTSYLHETRGSLHANHRTMAKFSCLKDIKFQRVVSVLQGWFAEYLKIQSSHQRFHDGMKNPSLPDGLIFDKELQACLMSLHSHYAKRRHEDIEPAYPRTYSWLFGHQVRFEDWLEGKNPSNLYWVQGKPGSGKSTLMKYAINHYLTRELLSKYDKGFWVVVGFFFHDRGMTMQKSAEGFLRHILHQILDQQKQLFVLIYPIFKEIIKQQEWSNDKSISLTDEWTLGRLRQAMTLIGRKTVTGVNVCLFVDALDEHDGSHGELILILRGIVQLTDNPLFRVRLAMAGRPENVFKSAFQSCPGFAIHEYTTDDIRYYTEERIQAEMRGNLNAESDEEAKNLVESIVQKAQGIFMWVRLAVNEIVEGLCEGDTIEELETLLSTIPTELRELYTRPLRRSPRSSLQAAARSKYEAYVMFQIASCATEPFSLYHFLAASLFLTTGKGTYPELQRLSEEKMERRLNSRSHGLLEAPREGKGCVEFIHQTVKEYMISREGAGVIREGLSDQRLESGYSLIFRYTLKLFENFTSEAEDLEAQGLVRENFLEYARILECAEQQCVAISFEPKILRFTEGVQDKILFGTLDFDLGFRELKDEGLMDNH